MRISSPTSARYTLTCLTLQPPSVSLDYNRSQLFQHIFHTRPLRTADDLMNSANLMFREAYSGTGTIIGVDANVELANFPRSENIGHPTTGEGHPTARAQAFRGLLKAKKLFACNTFGRVTDIAANHFTHTQRNGGKTSQKDFILDTWGPPISATIVESTESDHRRMHSVLALPAPRSPPWEPPFVRTGSARPNLPTMWQWKTRSRLPR